MLIDEPDEQKTIVRICELFDSGTSLHKIVKILTAEGQKPRGYDPGDVLHPEEDCGAEKSSYSFLLLDISNEDGREILA